MTLCGMNKQSRQGSHSEETGHLLESGLFLSIMHFHSACVCAQSLYSCRFFVTLWTVARQVPLSLGFSRQEYWSGLPCPPLGDLADSGIKPMSLSLLHWQGGSLPLAPAGMPFCFSTLYLNPNKMQGLGPRRGSS